MKFKDFEKAVQKTPVWAPVFRVTQAPMWAGDLNLKEDETLLYDVSKQSFVRKDGTLIALGASYVEFEGYRQIG